MGGWVHGVGGVVLGEDSALPRALSEISGSGCPFPLGEMGTILYVYFP